MFVLLEHATANGVHWDLMIEVPGRERLATWRLARNPASSDAWMAGREVGALAAAPEASIPAEPIGDHRRAYLDYEGPLSEGRGVVRRVDRGEARVVAMDERLAAIRLRGERLCGAFELRRTERGWVFRRGSSGAA